jgi:Restriction endonuclease BglII
VHDAPTMGVELIPAHLHGKYRFEEREHACAILAHDFPNEFSDILDCLDAFSLKRSYIATPGGSRSLIPRTIDGFLRIRGWRDKSFQIDIKIDEQSVPIPTHKIDNFKIVSASK